MNMMINLVQNLSTQLRVTKSKMLIVAALSALLEGCYASRRYGRKAKGNHATRRQVEEGRSGIGYTRWFKKHRVRDQQPTPISLRSNEGLIKRPALVREEESKGSKQIGRLKEDTIVTVKDFHDNRAQIEYRNAWGSRITGWISIKNKGGTGSIILEFDSAKFQRPKRGQESIQSVPNEGDRNQPPRSTTTTTTEGTAASDILSRRLPKNVKDSKYYQDLKEATERIKKIKEELEAYRAKLEATERTKKIKEELLEAYRAKFAPAPKTGRG